MRDDEHDGGNGHDLTPLPEIVERAAASSPTFNLTLPAPAPAEGKLSLLARVWPIALAAILGAAVGGFGAANQLGCGATRGYVREAVANAAAPVPLLTAEVEKLKTQQALDDFRWPLIQGDVAEIKADVKKLLGKGAQP